MQKGIGTAKTSSASVFYKVLACALSIAFAMSYSGIAYAATGDGSAGDFTVATTDGQWDYTDGVITIKSDGTYTITGNGSDHDGYQIVINGGITVNLTINNVKISNSSAAPMDIASSANVTLYLEGTNSFTSTAYGYAGIQFADAEEDSGSLEITSNSDGALTAQGGRNGAGIGSGSDGSASYITISGGIVTATGGNDAAGIGCGWGGSASNITISGGTVFATGGQGAAGIGGGWRGSASYITISGGTVTAEGGVNGAGIGSGTIATASNITITGGIVTATGGGKGAGIGGGNGEDGDGYASNITITGGIVTATGGNYASAGIGGGHAGSASNIEISGGIVTATGGNYASAIGGGWEGSGSNIKITGGTVTAKSTYGDAIGSGVNGEVATDITVNYEGDYYWRTSSSDLLTSSTTEELELPSDYTYVQITDKPGWTRLAGANRYGTMVKVVQEAFADNSASYVVIASGENFADSLAASSLAGALDAPIILVSASSLSTDAAEQIKRVGATYAYIVGGTASISASVQTQIANIVGSGNVERISGSDRYATSVEVAKKTISILGYTPSTVIIASGTVYADALSISPYAYTTASPIILVGSNGALGTTAANWLKTSGISSLIIAGGTSSVSNSVATQAGISNYKRLAGSNRYATSVEIANWAIQNGYLSADGAVIASGQTFPDALAASALCGQLGSVLLLVSNSSTSNAVVENFISTNASSMTYGYIVGGTSSVSTTVANTIATASGLSSSESSSSSSSSSSSGSSSSDSSSSESVHYHSWVSEYGVYECNKCKSTFTTGSSLDEHLREGTINRTCNTGYCVKYYYQCSCGATKVDW